MLPPRRIDCGAVPDRVKGLELGADEGKLIHTVRGAGYVMKEDRAETGNHPPAIAPIT
jgi:hypothetical protein